MNVFRFIHRLYLAELLRNKRDEIAEEEQRHVDYPRRIALWRADARELERRIDNARPVRRYEAKVDLGRRASPDDQHTVIARRRELAAITRKVISE